MPRPRSRDRSHTERSLSPPRTRSRSHREKHNHRHSSSSLRPHTHHPHHTHRHRSHTSSRSRSQSPSGHHHHHHHRSSHRRHRSCSRSTLYSPPPVLPGNARPLTKHDFPTYKDLFASYLDIQKGLILSSLSEREVKGRFKRFMTHWNRGELAKGWYDPTRKTASATTVTTTITGAGDASSIFLDKMSSSLESRRREGEGDVVGHGEGEGEGDNDNDGDGDGDGGDSEESSEEEIVGPLPPGYEASGIRKKGKKATVTMPTIEDLDLQKEQLLSDRLTAHTALVTSRKADLAHQKTALDELLPRAPPGSHAAKLEKKKLLNEKLRSFREKSPDMEVPDSEMMGSGGGSDNFKQLKAAKERKKNERELRKEAILRQRMEEREGRLRMHREKEERTIAMLKALAESAQRGR